MIIPFGPTVNVFIQMGAPSAPNSNQLIAYSLGDARRIFLHLSSFVLNLELGLS